MKDIDAFLSYIILKPPLLRQLLYDSINIGKTVSH